MIALKSLKQVVPSFSFWFLIATVSVHSSEQFFAQLFWKTDVLDEVLWWLNKPIHKTVIANNTFKSPTNYIISLLIFLLMDFRELRLKTVFDCDYEQS